MRYYLKTQEIADQLHVHPDKVRRWIECGELVGVNIAQDADGERPRWRVSPDALREFMDRRSEWFTKSDQNESSEMEEKVNKENHIEWIDCKSIQVSVSYQRQVSKTVVRRIVKNFNKKGFGLITVGRREDGSFWCIDGQTRLTAAIELGMEKVECDVHASTGKQFEAGMFLVLNNRRSVSPSSKLNALLCEEEPNALEMNRIVESCGYKLQRNNERGWPTIRAITSVEYAYEKGVLYEVMTCLQKAWGDRKDPKSIASDVISGLSDFIVRHGDVIKMDALIERMKTTDAQTVAELAPSQKLRIGGRRQALYEAFVYMWNYKRRNKLDVKFR